ncbi:Disease resistance response protein [Trema orientale]|uniref:Dirigent protein n=1 Tax=Trema orientale TaxID=63057 RepID=A0A2P5EVJ0_TREOI|nr:Disease resistance response protein [Trema orientale]
METHKSTPTFLIKAIAWILFLSLTITCTFSTRILDEETPEIPDSPQTSVVPTNPVGPAANPVGPIGNTVGPVATPVGPIGTPVGPIATPVGPATGQVGPVTTTAPTVATTDPHATLSFFMHDIVGGTNPSAIAVTGIVTNPAVSGQVPFAKPNGAVLPVNNGVPQNNNNDGIISNNNVPFFTGLAGNTANVLQNSNNNNNNFIAGGGGFPFVNGAQLPPGLTLQKLMFGTMTVFDDELTEGHELGSGLIGKAQGFYVASSVDGTSQIIAFTALFESGGYADSLTFFGVHMTAAAESHLAVMGGTGKYLNAKGYATVKTYGASADQHNTDGIETLLQFNVYLVY